MRNRLWTELTQSKHNLGYCIGLVSYQRTIQKWFNICILAFSTSGIMGWTIWKQFPIVVCFVITALELVKLLQPHLIPAEKNIDKIDAVAEFYSNYYNTLEQIWYDHYNERISDEDAQTRFYALKGTEKEINSTVTQLIRGRNKKLLKRTERETKTYFQRTFNV